ncbi:MAG: tryptophan--tRNA ligase [Candidatus Sungbacteria bacterium RIFCSPLOWO2_02_FULL_54_10]|uniref:Tryptophan--tRNA ligase n=2 Tax=Candidatus Sungiibacteriota TaxID=1817917 RepID=A0A1G2L516_9BACT|nr:MAG: tryptophan--tRNA ligase [Candidatus Sungbacteria bacterium RIFCSPHIGHO2_01_FULL_54_26]OHA02840.1 MAG: tryptophan--tRNA ligase [Candidatus Sungbacteria bacterium RIFCSPHIGHO2_02_FULL_53_17]OHA06614.1 MAG: tryptophan--tRNA ligase [Candidatus Sungbacteria bacterium RIFCSPLOWO2_01_FULL_54_21]OHA12442.1 MAG: tryptophan--tRNA ligase [Candidatus Sungbacteria bacterium RIFCSPLOWO2_02_FULL_54_10]
MNKQILLSGIQPSGALHIGNYLGAIKQWVDLQSEYRVFAMIADLHAITVPQEPEALRNKTLEVAALLIACGIDHKKSVIFIQSHVPAHAELAWVLNTITPLGELERMTQFKEKKDTSGEMAGLLNYPVLMAADILLYQTESVPVGEDQQQHLELTRSLANKFNNRFGDTFRIPKAHIQKDTARLMGLDDPTKKMSKSTPSANNYIGLLDTPDDIRRKIKIAITDSGKEIAYDEENKPAIANLLRIFSAFSGSAVADVETKYRGTSYAEFKQDLAELLVAKLEPIQVRYHERAGDQDALLKILKDGAEQARAIARETLYNAQNKMGFLTSLK